MHCRVQVNHLGAAVGHRPPPATAPPSGGAVLAPSFYAATSLQKLAKASLFLSSRARLAAALENEDSNKSRGGDSGTRRRAVDHASTGQGTTDAMDLTHVLVEGRRQRAPGPAGRPRRRTGSGTVSHSRVARFGACHRYRLGLGKSRMSRRFTTDDTQAEPQPGLPVPTISGIRGEI